ncbi:MAG: palindromic element RPE4 domain-containing protein [Rickettsia sp.]
MSSRGLTTGSKKKQKKAGSRGQATG